METPQTASRKAHGGGLGISSRKRIHNQIEQVAILSPLYSPLGDNGGSDNIHAGIAQRDTRRKLQLDSRTVWDRDKENLSRGPPKLQLPITKRNDHSREGNENKKKDCGPIHVHGEDVGGSSLQELDKNCIESENGLDEEVPSSVAQGDKMGPTGDNLDPYYEVPSSEWWEEEAEDRAEEKLAENCTSNGGVGEEVPETVQTPILRPWASEDQSPEGLNLEIVLTEKEEAKELALTPANRSCDPVESFAPLRTNFSPETPKLFGSQRDVTDDQIGQDQLPLTNCPVTPGKDICSSASASTGSSASSGMSYNPSTPAERSTLSTEDGPSELSPSPRLDPVLSLNRLGEIEGVCSDDWNDSWTNLSRNADQSSLSVSSCHSSDRREELDTYSYSVSQSPSLTQCGLTDSLSSQHSAETPIYIRHKRRILASMSEEDSQSSASNIDGNDSFNILSPNQLSHSVCEILSSNHDVTSPFNSRTQSSCQSGSVVRESPQSNSISGSVSIPASPPSPSDSHGSQFAIVETDLDDDEDEKGDDHTHLPILTKSLIDCLPLPDNRKLIYNKLIQ